MLLFSNVVITSFNFLGVIVSIITISNALDIFIYGTLPCEDESPGWTLAKGIFLLIMSLAGLIGAIRKSRTLMLIYVCMLFLVTVAVICIVVVSYLVISHSPADVMQANRGYRLEEFMPLLRKYVVDDGKWGETKKCMIQQLLCKKRDDSADYNEDLDSAKQLGCCRPPTQCGFERQNNTSWAVPAKGGLASKDNDCATWRNNGDTKCYDCDSCKAGHVAALVMELHRDFSSTIGFLVFLLILFIFASCALRNTSQKKIISTEAIKAAPKQFDA